MSNRNRPPRTARVPCFAGWMLGGLGFCLAAVGPARAEVKDDLTQLSLEQLLDVKIVTASKYEQRQSDVAAAVSVITRSEIKAHGWRTLAEALASLPGVYTSYDRQYTTLGTRGFSVAGDFGSRTLVTINGNRVNDPVYDSGAVGREFPLDLDLVDRIEYIPGPGGAVYGQNAMFGVINVVTMSGKDLDGAEIKTSFQGPQLLREGRATWGKAYEGGTDVLVSVSDMRARGQDHFYDFGAAGIAGVARGMDGEQDKQFLVQMRRGDWSFEVEHGNRRKDDPAGALLSDPLVPGGFEGDRFDMGQLRYQSDVADEALNVSARLFMGEYRFSSFFTYGQQPTASDALGTWVGGELRLVANQIAGHRPMFGVEIQDNLHQDQVAQNELNPAANVTVPSSGRRLGAYLQDEWRVSDAFTATLGVRGDHNNISGTSASPRAALIWHAGADDTLKFLYGRAFRAPNVFDCCYGDGVSQVANPHLKGETIDTFEVVGDHRLGGDLALRASLYQWHMQNIITLGIDPASGLSQYQSGPKVQAQGVELSTDKTWTNGARLRDSLAYQYAAGDGAGGLINSPRLLAKINLSLPLPANGRLLFSRLGYSASCNGAVSTLDGSKLGGYCLSNLYVTADTWARGLEVSLAVSNALGQGYAEPGAATNWQNALQQDGRSFRIELGYRF